MLSNESRIGCTEHSLVFHCKEALDSLNNKDKNDEVLIYVPVKIIIIIFIFIFKIIVNHYLTLKDYKFFKIFLVLLIV